MVEIKDAPQHIVILTGAGISAESGLETFRDKGGIWDKYDLTKVATPQAFERDPEFVQDFYNARRKQLVSGEVSPNRAHKELARLETNSHAQVTIITQNIDNLHEKAGSHNVLHMHGELLKCRCRKTGRVYQVSEDITVETPCQCCQEPGNLRPHVVWFGETPQHLEEIERCLETCDLFISIGTSGEVYPAAMFIDMVNAYQKAQTIEINPNATASSSRFQQVVQKKATEGVTDVVDAILKKEEKS